MVAAVESVALAVQGIAISGGIQARSADPDPVKITRQLECRKGGLNPGRARGEYPLGLAANDFIHRAGEIQAAEVAVCAVAQVEHIVVMAGTGREGGICAVEDDVRAAG